MSYIKLENCKHGYIYKIDSRNLIFGVFNKQDNGFIGIRLKFYDEYLFSEFHWDTGAPYGTVKPLKEIIAVPSHIPIRETLCSKDSITGRLVKFDRPVDEGGKGWYYIDNGESSQDIRPVSQENIPLFEYLKETAKEYYQKKQKNL